MEFYALLPRFSWGHCISVDPYYLTYSAKIKKINPKMILSGRHTNDTFYKYMCLKIYEKLRKEKIKK